MDTQILDERYTEMNDAAGDENLVWQGLLAAAKKAIANAREERVHPSAIRRMENQPRVHFNEDSLDRLAFSMSSIGQMMPGIIRPVKPDGDVRFELLDGERRWRAATRARLMYRATIVEIDDKVAPFIMAAVANFNREGHTPTEVSDTVARMRSMRIPMPEIAKVLGVSEFWANQMLGLQNLCEEVRAMLDPELPKRERLPVTAAIQISKMDESLQTAVAHRVLRGALSMKRLRSEVIRVSRVAGKPVKERQRRPQKVFESVLRNSGFMERLTDDLRADMRDPAFADSLRYKSVHLIDAIENGLNTARTHLLESEKLLKELRSR